MSHHSSDWPEEERALHERMRKLLGEFPDGKLNQKDEGAIAMVVGIENGRVMMKFPKPVAWIGFTADEAIGLAELLINRARQAGSTKPLAVTIGAPPDDPQR